MRPVHFFKAKSRLGLRNCPLGQTAENIGVENGADAIVTRSFAGSFSASDTSRSVFPTPDTISSDVFNSVLAKEYGAMRDFINASLKSGSTQVVIGGDHSVTFPSVLALLERTEDESGIGYIQFDSHGDMHLASTSPSGNFHGMYVRALVDRHDIPEIEALAPRKIPAENVLFIGNLDLQKEEEEYFSRRGIARISGARVRTRQKYVASSIRRFIKRFEHIHITFDIDCMDKSEAPATGIPAENGMRMLEIFPLLDEVADHPSISIDLVEVNPHVPGARKTIQLAQDILRAFLTESIEREVFGGILSEKYLQEVRSV